MKMKYKIQTTLAIDKIVIEHFIMYITVQETNYPIIIISNLTIIIINNLTRINQIIKIVIKQMIMIYHHLTFNQITIPNKIR